MSQSYGIGDQVQWKWGSSWAHGTIAERFTDDVTRTIKGTEVKRRAWLRPSGKKRPLQLTKCHQLLAASAQGRVLRESCRLAL